MFMFVCFLVICVVYRVNVGYGLRLVMVISMGVMVMIRFLLKLLMRICVVSGNILFVLICFISWICGVKFVFVLLW